MIGYTFHGVAHVCVFQRCKNFETDCFLAFLVMEKCISLEILCRWTHAHSSSVLLFSQPSSYRLSKATCFPRAKSMKSRAIPMHNFLLRYFPAYRTRMFPPVALLVICAHVLASVRLCICASVSGRNRASGNAEERKDE